MRTLLCYILLPINSAVITAQPVLLGSELPPIGTSTTYHMIYNYWAIDTTQQGAGVTWDFSAMDTVGDPVTWFILDPSATTNGSSFPNANYARMYGPSSHVTYFERTETYLDILGTGSLGPNIYSDPQRANWCQLRSSNEHPDRYRQVLR